ncbi:MAG: hypothetical protein HYU77_10690 [Betaproteobacteria bacterium]|nr:hypothetical protein [Betaproteobacteria bacterium]
MHDTLTLPKTLRSRLEKAARAIRRSPEALARQAIAERLDYLEWEERMVAEGDADLKAGRVVTGQELRAALDRQRVARAKVRANPRTGWEAQFREERAAGARARAKAA